MLKSYALLSNEKSKYNYEKQKLYQVIKRHCDFKYLLFTVKIMTHLPVICVSQFSLQK